MTTTQTNMELVRDIFFERDAERLRGMHADLFRGQ